MDRRFFIGSAFVSLGLTDVANVMAEDLKVPSGPKQRIGRIGSAEAAAVRAKLSNAVPISITWYAPI